MQRNAGAADFLYQLIATRMDLFEIGRPKRRLSRPGENKVSHFEIAHGPIVGRGDPTDLLGDAQGSFACLVRGADVADQGWINALPVNDQGIIAYLAAIH